MTESSLDIRRRILRRLEAFPGLHLREVARQEGLSEALAGYHLDALVAQGDLEERVEANYRRFYPTRGATPTDEERALLGVLRQPAPLEIVVFLFDRDEATHAEITGQLGLSKSTVSYHLHKLVEAGLVAPVEGRPGFRLVDAKRIGRLLIKWEPTRDATDRFSRLWGSFYGPRARRR
jgi:predicted transcriptional regulator